MTILETILNIKLPYLSNFENPTGSYKVRIHATKDNNSITAYAELLDSVPEDTPNPFVREPFVATVLLENGISLEDIENTRFILKYIPNKTSSGSFSLPCYILQGGKIFGEDMSWKEKNASFRILNEQDGKKIVEEMQ